MEFPLPDASLRFAAVPYMGIYLKHGSLTGVPIVTNSLSHDNDIVDYGITSDSKRVVIYRREESYSESLCCRISSTPSFARTGDIGTLTSFVISWSQLNADLI